MSQQEERRVQIRLPGDLHLPQQFFGLASARDLVRVGLPTAAVFFLLFPIDTVVDVAAVLTVFLTGIGLSVWTPFGQPVEAAASSMVRWLLNQSRVRDNALWTCNRTHLVTTDGTVMAVINVTPTNLQLQTGGEQQALHRVYQDLLDTVTYPITVYSRQEPLDLAPYIAQLHATADSDASHQRQLRDAYTAYCRHLNDRDLVQTQHYILVRVEPAGIDNVLRRVLVSVAQRVHPVAPTIAGLFLAPGQEPEPDADEAAVSQQRVAELDRRVTELVNTIDRGGLAASRVTGDQLETCAQTFHTGIPALHPHWVTTPHGTEEGSERSDLGDEYRRQLYLSDCPSQAPLAWPVSLLNLDGLVDIAQVIRPQPTADVVTRLRRTVDKLKAEITSQEAAGYSGTQQYSARLDDAEWMLDLLADRRAGAVEYGCYITAHHADRDRCQETFDAVQTRLQTLQFAVQEPVFRTDQAYRSQSPLHGDGLDETMLMPASSAAAGFPFGTTDALSQSGIVFGEHSTEGTPIVADRFEWSSHSLARMGMVGSGKSYATKLELLRSWLAYPDLDVFIVDPKQEYGAITSVLGGVSYTLGVEQHHFSSGVTRFTVPDRGQDVNVALLRQVVQQLYQYTSRNRRKTVVVIDEARILLNDEQGRDVVNQFVLEARDTNTAVTLVTQNASHFTHSRAGREVLDNIPAKQFMRHERVPQSVVDYFQLSAAERHTLFNLQTGTDSPTSEAVLKLADRVDATITVRSTAAEHRIITRGEQA